MSDSLSHSCPTCGGTGILHEPCDAHPTTIRCPDCYDGVYPKAAVERAAKAIEDVGPDREFEDYALAAIRAYHNEGRSEG